MPDNEQLTLEERVALLEEDVDKLDKAVKENTRVIGVHSAIGWTVFILWLLGFIITVLLAYRYLHT
jgi:hypothetical protein